jgi:hypothetical protein
MDRFRRNPKVTQELIKRNIRDLTEVVTEVAASESMRQKSRVMSHQSCVNIDSHKMTSLYICLQMDKDIFTLQTQTNLSKLLRALKNLSGKERRYKIIRCPSCRDLILRDLITGEEITVKKDDILNECIQLPIGE